MMKRFISEKRFYVSAFMVVVLTAVALLTALTSFRALPAQAAVSAKTITSIEDYFDLPVYDEKSREASVEINGGKPYFAPEDAAFLPEQYYGELDSLGRCMGAYALLSEELMPTDCFLQALNTKKCRKKRRKLHLHFGEKCTDF